MAPVLVQSKFVQAFGQNTTTLTFNSRSVPGNCVVVGLVTYTGGGSATVTDTQGNVYTLGPTVVVDANVSMYIYYALNIEGEGANLGVIVDPTGATTDITLAIAEFSGVLRVSAGDGTNTASGNSTSPTISTTSSADGDLVIGLLTHNGTNRTLTETGSTTLIQEQEGGTSNMPLSLTYKIAGAAGSQTSSWTIGTGAVAWNCVQLLLKAQDYSSESQGDKMFVPNGGNEYGWMVQNQTSRPAGFLGTSFTPGQNTKGSWARLLSAIANDCYKVEICINNVNVSAAARDMLVDIGIDEAGGSSYTVKIPDLIGSCASTMDSLGGIWYVFPLFIKAGSTIAARGSVNNASVGGGRVWIRVWGRPKNPEMCRVGSRVEAIGVTSASSNGTAVTPGTTSDGSWTNIGTTANQNWWWQAGMGVNDSTMAAVNYMLDVAVGSSGEVPLITDQLWRSDASERHSNYLFATGCERDVAAGTAIYARLQCSGTADANTSVAVYGLGG